MASSPAARARSTADWLCRTCLDRSGAPFRNFGHRKDCYKCSVSKGRAFGQKVEVVGQPSSRTSTAARQRGASARAAASTAKGAEAVGSARSRHRDAVEMCDGDDDESMDAGTPDEEECYSVEQLLQHNKLLLSFGRTEKHPDVAGLALRIVAAQEEKRAKQPDHVRLARSEKLVKQRTAAVEACTGEADNLEEQLLALTTKLGEFRAKCTSARAALAEAEREREELLVAVAAGRVPAPPAAAGAYDALQAADCIVAASAMLPDELFAGSGLQKEAFLQALLQLAAVCTQAGLARAACGPADVPSAVAPPALSAAGAAGAHGSGGAAAVTLVVAPAPAPAAAAGGQFAVARVANGPRDAREGPYAHQTAA